MRLAQWRGMHSHEHKSNLNLIEHTLEKVYENTKIKKGNKNMEQEVILIENMRALVAYIQNPIAGAKVIIGFNSLANMTSILSRDIMSKTYLKSRLYSRSASDFLDAPELNIGGWDVSKVTNMQYIFASATRFNSNLNDWDVSNVRNTRCAFAETRLFNQPLDNWDVSNVKSMRCMFRSAKKFNQPLNSWNTKNVRDLGFMFAWASVFNQPLNKWETKNVNNMESLFRCATDFDQELAMWDTANVTSMAYMFNDASNFNQSLNDFDTTSLVSVKGMLQNSVISEKFIPERLRAIEEKEKEADAMREAQDVLEHARQMHIKQWCSPESQRAMHAFLATLHSDE